MILKNFEKYFFCSLCLAVSMLLTVCGALQNVHAQGSVNIKENNLKKSPNFSIGGTIIGVDVYNPNLNFFIEGKLMYRFKNEVGWIKGNYSIAYTDRLQENIESTSGYESLPANGTQPLKNVGGSIGFNFLRKERYKLSKTVFSSTSRSITMPIKSYRLYGIHGGFESFRTIVAQGSATSYTGTIHGSLPHDTTVVTDYATPMFKMNIISFGIHRQLIEHYVLAINDGTYETTYMKKSSSMVYADFLFGMNMLFDDILVPLNGKGPNSNPATSASGQTQSYNFYRADINGSYKKIPIGGRLGWEYTGLKSVGLLAGAEIGFRPGIIDPSYNLYILAKLGISFNMKLK